MEGARQNLPMALRVRMNTDGEVSTFQSFMRQRSDLTLASSAVIQSTYEEKTSQFVRIADNTGLRAALQRYLDDDPKADFWQTFDAESCSWDQVFEELNNAEEVYKGISQFGKTVFGDSLRDLNIILKPLEDAEKRLNQCQDMLDTRGIAATRHISEETVQKVNSVQQVAESNGNKLDQMGAALEAMSSKFSSWEQRGQQERAVHLEDNKVHDIIQQMTSFFQMYHEKMATCPGKFILCKRQSSQFKNVKIHES
ncbi:hypothetical protein ACHAO9_008410 [Fusarium lateritium]